MVPVPLSSRLHCLQFHRSPLPGPFQPFANFCNHPLTHSMAHLIRAMLLLAQSAAWGVPPPPPPLHTQNDVASDASRIPEGSLFACCRRWVFAVPFYTSLHPLQRCRARTSPLRQLPSPRLKPSPTIRTHACLPYTSISAAQSMPTLVACADTQCLCQSTHRTATWML